MSLPTEAAPISNKFVPTVRGTLNPPDTGTKTGQTVVVVAAQSSRCHQTATTCCRCSGHNTRADETFVFQEAQRYFNQTTKQKEMLEFALNYLQTDDEVSFYCCTCKRVLQPWCWNPVCFVLRHDVKLSILLLKGSVCVGGGVTVFLQINAKVGVTIMKELLFGSHGS